MTVKEREDRDGRAILAIELSRARDRSEALGMEAVRAMSSVLLASSLFMMGFAVAGLTAHTIYLVMRSQKSGLPPLLSSSQDWMLVLAWKHLWAALCASRFARAPTVCC